MSQKILVVDDSENIRSVLQMNFEWMGYDVISVPDGMEAIAAVARDRPDLIILDVMMPRKNGYQVCRQFKSDPTTADIPVILLTAKNQQEDVFWGRDCGADDYITKPFNSPELEHAVHRLLDRCAPTDAEAFGSVAEMVAARVREGDVCGLCTFRLDPAPLTVHRQKYGELRHRELVEAVSGAIRAVLRKEGFPPAMEQHDEKFQVMLPCTVERVRIVQDHICQEANRRVLEYYDPADRDRGHVTSRDYRSDQEIRVPIVTLHADSPRIYNQD